MLVFVGEKLRKTTRETNKKQFCSLYNVSRLFDGGKMVSHHLLF